MPSALTCNNRGRGHVDRQVLAEQIAREGEQRRALVDFVARWDSSGGRGEPT